MIAVFLRDMSAGMVLALAVWACLWPLRKRRLRRLGLVSRPRREWALAAFVLYCGGMAMLTLTPRDFHPYDALARGYPGPFFRIGTLNLALLRSLRYSKAIFLANVVMFLPFGWMRGMLWRRSRWYTVAALACAITAAVELFQLLVGRAFDVDDLLLNAVGTFLGWLLWLLLKKPSLYCEDCQ